MAKWYLLFTDNGAGFDDNFILYQMTTSSRIKCTRNWFMGPWFESSYRFIRGDCCCKSSKLNKSAGIDGFIAELVKNNVSIQFLHALYSFCFEHGISPEIWQNGVIHPILKPGMDEREPPSYRGITLISVICKIYCDILRERLTNFLEKERIIKEEQNGFRKKGVASNNIGLAFILLLKTENSVKRIPLFVLLMQKSIWSY